MASNICNNTTDAEFVETVMSPSLTVKPATGTRDLQGTPRKRNLSNDSENGIESCKKLKPATAGSEHQELLNLIKTELSSFKANFKDTIENKLESFEQRIKKTIESVVKDEIKVVRDEFNARIDGLSNKLEQKILKVVQTKIDDQIKIAKSDILKETNVKNLQDEISKVKISYAAAAAASVAVDPIEKNICIRNLNFDQREKTDSGVTLDKVNGIIRDGLKMKDVKVTHAVRKETKGRNPGVVIATIETVEQKIKIIENKKVLRKTTNFANVYIENDKKFEVRAAENNMRILLKEIGKSDKFVFSNGRLQQKQHNRGR